MHTLVSDVSTWTLQHILGMPAMLLSAWKAQWISLFMQRKERLVVANESLPASTRCAADI